MIAPFLMPAYADEVADLVQRLRATRFPDAVTQDWSYGTETGFLKDVVDHWANGYVWEARHERLSGQPHFQAMIDGYGLHFLRFGPGVGSGVPLLLMNGWPSSFVEYQKLMPLLTTGERPFDVIIPTHPGFGFSDRPVEPYQIEPHDLYPRLMTMLGHDRFLVAGTDIGAGIATRIALHHPDRVIAAHVSAVAAQTPGAGSPAYTSEEAAYTDRVAAWVRDEGGYMAIQSSKPQTLAFGLTDSPAGLASWVLEKFRSWTDCGGDLFSVWSRDDLIDNLMTYWLTNTTASSIRYYYEASRLRPPLSASDYVVAPTAIAMWPADIATAPRAIAERLYNVQAYSVMPRGGHFPAWEQPTAYAEQLRLLAKLGRC